MGIGPEHNAESVGSNHMKTKENYNKKLSIRIFGPVCCLNKIILTKESYLQKYPQKQRIYTSDFFPSIQTSREGEGEGKMD